MPSTPTRVPDKFQEVLELHGITFLLMKYTSAHNHQCYLPVLELYKGFQDIQKLSRDYDSTYLSHLKFWVHLAKR